MTITDTSEKKKQLHKQTRLEANYDFHQGTVFRKLQGTYFVRTDSGIVTCSIPPRFRRQLLYPTSHASSGTLRRVQSTRDIKIIDPVAVGDEVKFIQTDDGLAVIREILPRRNKLVRHAAGLEELEQIIATNVDQIVPIISAAQPAPKWGLLDRILAIAEDAEIPAQICLTKLDLVKRYKLQKAIDIYQKIGYPVWLSSAMTGEGIPEVKTMLQNKVSVLIGMSGVGKSTLLNAIQDNLGLRVNEISQANNKGKHTTTHLEMFDLESGGSVVDTPGMKLFGLWQTDPAELTELFVELRPYSGRCKFRLDCTHDHEPGCAVKTAVTNGDISQMRYKSFLKIQKYIRPSGK